METSRSIKIGVLNDAFGPSSGNASGHTVKAATMAAQDL
jgi:hypothetical protein